MKRLTLIITLFACGFLANAQKVKYKDLYVLLRAKNYNDAAPFLKKFLSDNPEHPNANYQMGLMLEFKLNEYDILKEPDAIVQRADSSIEYFDKAFSFINEKDVKKHDDDYYELFKRRNLRSGKFEVILSDVQLDIDNRKNELTNKKLDIKRISTAFNNSIKFYNSARLSFKLLKESYHDQLTMSLGARDSTINRIKQTIVDYDSAVMEFKSYKKLKKHFASSSFETIIISEQIEGFAEKGLTQPDFYSKKVKFINFSAWGKNQIRAIEKQQQLLARLILFDESLEEMENWIKNDSIDLSSEIFKKITDPSLKQLKTIDQESLILSLFNYKIGQLNFNSALINWYKSIADTTDVGIQLGVVDNLEKELEGLELLTQNLVIKDELFWEKYHSFITARYTSQEGLNTYIDSQKDVLADQVNIVEVIMERLKERDFWGYVGEDSVSLVLGKNSAKYKSLKIDSLEKRVFRVTGITQIEDKRHYFFVTVPSSRQIDSIFTVEVSIKLDDAQIDSIRIESAPAILNTTLYLIGSSNFAQFSLIHFSETTGVLWERTIELNISDLPILEYVEGQILVSQGDKIQKFTLDDGAPID